VGPSAHSFDGKNRGSNISNNARYINLMRNDTLAFELDNMTAEDLANEYILTSLRTIWGIDLNHLKHEYQDDLIHRKSNLLMQLNNEGLIEIDQSSLRLSQKGKLLADSVASALFI
jgi:oxygen-independent coproporphyrinogen-3 oxidase